MAFYPPKGTCKEITLTSNIQLDYPYSMNSNNVTVSDMMDIAPTIPNLKIILPDSTFTSPGFAITFNNVGSANNSFNIVLNDGVTNLISVAQGIIVTVYLYNNSTVNGNWRVFPFGGGVSSISSMTIASPDSSIDISNGTISPPGGTVNVTLPAIISNIQTLKTGIAGFVTINQNDIDPWGVVSINGGSNITVVNPDASTGTPVINLNTNISIAQVTAGNVVINGNLITLKGEGNLNIASNLVPVGGTATVGINGVLFDTNNNVNNINDLTISGQFSAPGNAKAWCRFTNTSGTITLPAAYNVSSVTYNVSNNQYTINFVTPMVNSNYIVHINCSNDISTGPIPVKLAYDVARTNSSVSVVLTDASGEPLINISEGVSVIIFSSN